MNRRTLFTMSRHVALASILAVPSLLAPLVISAAEPVAARAEQPMRDPWVPPEARKHSQSAPVEGAALRAEVERKLRHAFDDADVGRTGAVTRQQANAAGLGFVARHFDEIDRQRSGTVRFDDVRRFLVERGARLD